MSVNHHALQEKQTEQCNNNNVRDLEKSKPDMRFGDPSEAKTTKRTCVSP